MVKAQYEALTPETLERLNNVLSKKKVNSDTHVSLARSWTSQDQSKSSPACIVTFL